MNRSALIAIAVIASTLVSAQEPQPPAAPKHKKPPLTEEQRAELEEQFNNTWNTMPFDQKARLMHLHRALNEMPPEERRFIHDRVERFLNMSPEEREKLAQNRKKWEQMTPEQRQQAREKFHQKRKEFEDK